jgi:hypothetical protein
VAPHVGTFEAPKTGMIANVVEQRASGISQEPRQRWIDLSRLTKPQADMKRTQDCDLGQRRTASMQMSRIAEHAGGLVANRTLERIGQQLCRVAK